MRVGSIEETANRTCTVWSWLTYAYGQCKIRQSTLELERKKLDYHKAYSPVEWSVKNVFRVRDDAKDVRECHPRMLLAEPAYRLQLVACRPISKIPPPSSSTQSSYAPSSSWSRARATDGADPIEKTAMKRGGKGTGAGAPAAAVLLLVALLVLAAPHADAAAARRLGAADSFPSPNGCSYGETNQSGACHGHDDVGTTGFQPTPWTPT